MNKKVFIAVNPTKIERDNIYQLLLDRKDLFPPCSVKWVNKENLHITLIFLGVVREDRINSIFEAVLKSLENSKPFKISLNQINYYPESKNPLIIWARGDENTSLYQLKNNIYNNILSKGVRVISEERELIPHITLGRVKKWGIKNIKAIPDIEETINISLSITSVDVIESVINKGYPSYKILKSFPL